MINSDELTIRQARELVKQFASPQNCNGHQPHPAVGKYCVIRSYAAGVHIADLLAGLAMLAFVLAIVWGWL